MEKYHWAVIRDGVVTKIIHETTEWVDAQDGSESFVPCDPKQVQKGDVYQRVRGGIWEFVRPN